MKILTMLLGALLLMPLAQADMVKMKSGRVLEANKVWVDDGRVYLANNGNQVSFSEDLVEYIDSSTLVVDLDNPEEDPNRFQFDGWESWTSIEDIMRRARLENIPMRVSRDEVIKAYEMDKSTAFRYRLSAKHADTATQYQYQARLLGKDAIAKINLTPFSKRLHTISIHWSLTSKTEREDISQAVMSWVKDRYSVKPKDDKSLVTDATTEWEPNGNLLISSSVSPASLTLKLVDLNAKEIAQAESIMDRNTTRGTIIEASNKD